MWHPKKLEKKSKAETMNHLESTCRRMSKKLKISRLKCTAPASSPCSRKQISKTSAWP